jgi:nitrogenase cofactor biosynthesis protein NifB
MSKTKIEPMVNLNTNPCKMCMPLGSVTAFYGIKNCMSILHGSQGCSTYIRRHMATHYNEPVDIASSSLTEQGTVFGGETNLLKGLKNLIEIYHPEVIGVSTTCLAETIGEDLPRMIGKFYSENPEYKNIEIIPVKSPGYGGTQYEGYFSAIFGIISSVAMQTEANDCINVITAPLTPADTRFLKEAFEMFGLKIILLPDVSENLDGGYKEEYDKLPSGGTSLKDIKKMAGAKATIELCGLEIKDSPGKYLENHYGVPYYRINMPVGLRDTDIFYDLLSKLSEIDVPEEITIQRGRYLDAMIDAHKYNGEGRAVIFGEPDYVASTVRLCVENGVMPLVVATGSVCNDLKELLKDEIDEIAKKYFIDRYEILQDVDFKTIEALAKELHANLLIGSSDGRRMEESLGIPLVRRGFPIHDRVGGQRLRMLGYEGSLDYMEDIANGLLSKKEADFRENIHQQYYKKELQEDKIKELIEEKTKNHPCFNGCASNTARMHLAVAPRCNIQCNYCVRKFDCPNESRPGVTSKILTPTEALEKYKMVKKEMSNLSVVGIAGPGDALANFEETKKTLELIREFDPDVTFCLSTNGLMLPQYANELIRLGVSHVTVTMNAVDINIGAKIYKHIDYNGVKFEGVSAAAILLANQLSGLRILVAAGIICKVNIVTLKGINDKHIPKVVETVKEIGCYVTNIMPFIQVKGSVFENLEPVSNKEVNEIRNLCGETMKQMYHCRQCRADAIGTLDNDRSLEFSECKGNCGSKKIEEGNSYTFAVASKSGMLVDTHFGHVAELYIYEYKDGDVCYKEKREIQKYCTGEENCGDEADKIDNIIKAIGECDGVITMRIGEAPRQKLNKKNVKVFVTYDRIDTAVKFAAEQMDNGQ